MLNACPQKTLEPYQEFECTKARLCRIEKIRGKVK